MSDETRDVELESLFTEVAKRKDEMERARVVWREVSNRVTAALNERIGQIDQDAAVKHALGPEWLDEIEATHARNVTRLLAAFRTALEGLDEIGQGTADAGGYDHVLARLARLATIEMIGEGEDGAWNDASEHWRDMGIATL